MSPLPKKPNILAFDTATDACSCAILTNDHITEQFEIAPRRHADQLLPMVHALLKTTQVTLSDIDAFAFGVGPGSFMGVRIATAIAQGLGFATQRPLIPISTLHALAEIGYETTKHPAILAGWDAKMGAIYWGAYRTDQHGRTIAWTDDQLTHPETLSLPPNDTRWIAVGNAWTVYRAVLPNALMRSVEIIENDIYPRASAIAKLAEHQYHAGKYINPSEAGPRYLRNEVAKQRAEDR